MLQNNLNELDEEKLTATTKKVRSISGFYACFIIALLYDLDFEKSLLTMAY